MYGYYYYYYLPASLDGDAMKLAITHVIFNTGRTI